MLVLAEFGLGSAIWSIVVFFLFLMWMWLVISVFADIIRSDDLSGGAKAVWTIVIILLPYLGVFAYLLSRGGRMGERAMQRAEAQERQVETYIRDVASASTADELEKLGGLHRSGIIDDAEYQRLKAQADQRLIGDCSSPFCCSGSTILPSNRPGAAVGAADSTLERPQPQRGDSYGK